MYLFTFKKKKAREQIGKKIISANHSILIKLSIENIGLNVVVYLVNVNRIDTYFDYSQIHRNTKFKKIITGTEQYTFSSNL